MKLVISWTAIPQMNWCQMCIKMFEDFRWKLIMLFYSAVGGSKAGVYYSSSARSNMLSLIDKAIPDSLRRVRISNRLCIFSWFTTVSMSKVAAILNSRFWKIVKSLMATVKAKFTASSREKDALGGEGNKRFS